MNILFITAGGPDEASTRYRVLNLLPGLRLREYEPTVIQSPDDDLYSRAIFASRILKEAVHCDIVFIQKVILPPWFINIISQIVEVVVFDFDDALYASPPGKDNSKLRADRLNTVLSQVDIVIAGSPVLASYARKHSETVHCLPTSVPQDDYLRETNQRTENSVRIGWIGNPENLRYLIEITDPLTKVLDRYQDTELLIITAGDLPVEPLRSRKDVTYATWSRDREIELLSTVDIGIRPLWDDEWTRAKGGFTSVVQCMALRLPVIVSPVGMLTEIVSEGKSGYFATTEDEWITYLSILIEDDNKRNEMGRSAYKSLTKKRFWSEQRAADLSSILRQSS